MLGGMRRIAPVLLACLALASCGGGGEPSVDWSNVPANQRTAIEDAAQAKDCAQMQTYFDGSKRADVLNYLDWHMKQAGCY